jgi:hypothetical protein
MLSDHDHDHDHDHDILGLGLEAKKMSKDSAMERRG